MAVDNHLVNDLDMSALPPNIFMIEWRESKGEIQYGNGQQDSTDSSNGLRDTFTDVTPYADLFQQFLAKVPNLTLAQAQRVQNTLVKNIFDDKRTKPLSSGGTTFDTDDESVAALSQKIADLANDLRTEMKAKVDKAANDLADSVNNTTSYPAHGDLAFVGTGFVDSINAGIAGHTNIGYVGLGAGITPPVATPAVLPAMNVNVLPHGSSTPTSLPLPTVCQAMKDIGARRDALRGTQQGKQNAINALTSVSAVIAYDVTAGW